MYASTDAGKTNPIKPNFTPSVICVLLPIATAVLSLGALAIAGCGGWPGETGVSAYMFCEAFRPGIIKQPANTWSNLGFTVVGILIGFQAWRDLKKRPSSNSNRMTTTIFYPAFYACLVVLLGTGSMAMHASTTGWGGSVDVFSMYLWAGYFLMYALARLFGLSRLFFLAGYALIVVPIGMDLFTDRFSLPIHSDNIFGILVVSAAFLELLLILLRQELSRKRYWLWCGIGAFLAAFAIWLPSRTGKPLCYPQSVFQGHALWHLLCAVSTLAFYLYYRSEKNTE